MEKNWFNCPEMWALYERQKLPHFRNHTNNRLESWFGKFKAGVNENSSMVECFKALVSSARLCQRDYEFATKRPGRYVNQNYDEEMSNVLLVTTPFVAEQILPQYTAAIEKYETYGYMESEKDQFVIVKGANHDSVVDLQDGSCSCPFATTMRLPCRHLMAWRKFNGKPAIQLSRIDVRWKKAWRDPPAAPRFTLNKPEKRSREPTIVSDGDEDAKGRDRYNEAMRVLKPIASEVAEIEDPAEFHYFLGFLKQQWRNVRQRKRVVDEDASVPTESHQVAEIELSQANSLWSEEVGDVPAPTLTNIRFDSPVRPQPENLVSPRIPGADAEDPGQASTVKTRGSVQDGAGVGSSRASSSSHGGDMENPGADMASQRGLIAQDDEARVTSDVEDDGSGESGGDETTHDAENAVQEGASIPIKLNQEAKKTGRPKNNPKLQVAELRMQRGQFNASQKVPRAYGELSLKDVIDSLDADQPSLAQVRQRLAGVSVKFAAEDKRKPKYEHLRDPVINQDAYYLLPPRLLEACVKKLPLATTSQDAIRVGTPDPATQAPAAKSGKGEAASRVEVVSINGVGAFTRQQIESMRRVENLIKLCGEGEALVEWLQVEVASSVPTVLRDQARSLASQVKESYPSAVVKGLSGANEYVISMLYRVKPKSWLDDAIISAFCERVEQVYAGCIFAGMCSRKKVGRAPQSIDTAVHDRITTAVGEPGTQTVLVPINFLNLHWAALIVDVSGKKIKYYVSMNMYVTQLDQLAHHLHDDTPALEGYEIVAVNSPIQQDGYSCRLFVCYKFWREVDKVISTDMSKYAERTRRLEFLHFVLRGSKIA